MNAFTILEKHAAKISIAFAIIFIVCISLPVMWLFLVTIIVLAALFGCFYVSIKALSISRESAEKLQVDKLKIEETAIARVIPYLTPKTQAGMIRAGIDGFVRLHFPESCWYTKDARNMESILLGKPMQIPFVILRESPKRSMKAIAYIDPDLGSLERCEVEGSRNVVPAPVIPCKPLPGPADDKSVSTAQERIDTRTPAVFQAAAKTWVEMNSQMIYTRMKDSVTSGNQYFEIKTAEITADDALCAEVIRFLEAEFGEVHRSGDTLLIPCQNPDADEFDS